MQVLNATNDHCYDVLGGLSVVPNCSGSSHAHFLVLNASAAGVARLVTQVIPVLKNATVTQLAVAVKLI